MRLHGQLPPSCTIVGRGYQRLVSIFDFGNSLFVSSCERGSPGSRTSLFPASGYVDLGGIACCWYGLARTHAARELSRLLPGGDDPRHVSSIGSLLGCDGSLNASGRLMGKINFGGWLSSSSLPSALTCPRQRAKHSTHYWLASGSEGS